MKIAPCYSQPTIHVVDASKSVVVVSNGRSSFLRGSERGGKRETETERGDCMIFMCKSKKILYQLCHLCYVHVVYVINYLINL